MAGCDSNKGQSPDFTGGATVIKDGVPGTCTRNNTIPKKKNNAMPVKPDACYKREPTSPAKCRIHTSGSLVMSAQTRSTQPFLSEHPAQAKQSRATGLRSALLLTFAAFVVSACSGGSDEGSGNATYNNPCLLYTSPSPRDQRGPRMPSSA